MTTQPIPPASEPQPPPSTAAVYVDLDGTLLSSDMLWETACLLLCQEPLRALSLPFWLFQGKAGFKREIAQRVSFDPALLPYRPEVLEYLRAEKAAGRRLVLATASHQSVAQSIADHLGLFDSVLASDGETNLSGAAKLAAIQRDSAMEPFEYLGNDARDIPIWQHATISTLVQPTRRAAAAAGQLAGEVKQIETPRLGLGPTLKALRSYQWIKNALLWIPILLAHELGNSAKLWSVSIAFVSFCAIASATYMLNDLLDIESDRRHERKRDRPFAAGTLPIPTGVLILSGLLFSGFALSLATLPLISTGMLAIYAALTISYSLYLKEKLFVDVLVLAGLFTHRVLSGAVAADVRLSPWLLAFSLFFFLSLALLKRYAELLASEDNGSEINARRAYQVMDIGLVENMGLAAGYLAVLVLCLFVSSDDVSRLYPNPDVLWLVMPPFLYWISRMWFLARRKILLDDPVLFAATDRVSWLTGMLIAFIGTLAAW
ncbi:MAG: UbiA family prenyltransferase [Deltaproteobacteria bacterium]|nr:UbiA family prenyltransferase [Deltaproteobacteria bacterium]